MSQRKPARYWLQLALTLAVCAFLVVPVAMSILAGLTENYFLGAKSGLTLRWVGEVWSLYHETIWRSIGIALACLAMTLGLGIPAAYALARAQSRWTRWIEELLTLPIAVPGLATALALILLYGGWRDFRASWAFILVGHVLFTLPFMVRSVLAVMLAVDLATLEEAAASLGA
jgi:putative spermidine/putrescine transport system permease protein